MRVRLDPVSATEALVESPSLECENFDCGRSFDRRKPVNAQLVAGDQCRKCGAVLREKWHKVDVSVFWPVGECQCEDFQLNPEKRAKVSRMSPAELEKLSHIQQEQLRCSHLGPARDAILNRCIKDHEQRRTKGRKEET